MCTSSKIFLTAILLLSLWKFSYSRQFRLAWMAPANTYYGLNATSSVGGLLLALKSITHPNSTFLIDHTINVRWYNSDCNSKSALAAVVKAQDDFLPDAFLGPPCSSAMKMVAQFASVYNKPVIGWVSNDIEFRDKTIYSTLLRLLGPLNRFPTIMDYVSKTFKWKRYSMIHDEDAPYKAVAVAIAENKEITIHSVHEVSVNSTDHGIERIFQQVRKYSRIIIMAVPWLTLRKYMIIAHRLGMSNGDFAFLCIHGDLFTVDELNKNVLSDRVWRNNDKDDAGARKAFESVIHIMTATLKEDLDRLFKYNIHLDRSYTNSLWQLPTPSDPDAYSAYLYDATMVWAITVNKLLQENKDPSNGQLLFKTALDIVYPEGLTGPIRIDDYGDRFLNFLMLDMLPNGTFEKVMQIEFTKSGTRFHTWNKPMNQLVHWPNGKVGKDNAPPDIPICGFENEHCREDFTNTIVGAVCGSSFVVVVAIVINIVLRRYRRVQLLKSMLWQVKFEDIDFVTALLHGSVRNSFKNLSRRRTSSNKKKVSRTSSGGGTNSSLACNSSPPQFHKPDPGAMFGSVAYVKGSLVSVKRVDKGNIPMTEELLHQLNQLMELKHQNVCAFVGASFDPGRILMLWEYCPKGSLQDVIWNQNIKLDRMFMFALSLDIVKGLDFIHKSSVQFHGNLKSSNCVVDSRWTCKLTDFGAPSIRFANRNINEEAYDKLLWTSPEVLRNEKNEDKQKADLFSLGIILKEVFTRSGPYTEFSFLSPSDVIEKVKEVPAGQPFRPLLTVDFRKQNPDLFALIDELWHDDPLHRPSASRAYKSLHRINPSKNLTMIDNMIAILEKYANHLEELVAERTSELDAEKKKTENLLYRMLPRSVAEDLKAGKQVKAEHFDEATIYFSDIVGFTTICASSTPIEVVNLLNSLYTLFDDIITHNDVYKVETIGDAYMLASGLPKRNGTRHIREIADCALNILESIKTFYIPHQQNQNVKIRIGIHSGSVVAGVVGMAMPRYCLFGDTVNTASRMESTGLPMKIHLSTVAAENLKKYENYILKCRGDISVKGKGIMKTYFLNGKTEGNQQLPAIDEDNKSLTISNSAEDDLSQPSPKMRHISTISNALECRVGIGHVGECPDIIHKSKSRPSLASILSITEHFNPVRRSSSTDVPVINNSNFQSGYSEHTVNADSSSERTTSLESGYFPADSSCSSIERNSPGVHRTISFGKGEILFSEKMDEKTRKNNVYSAQYYPQSLNSCDNVIQKYSLETCIDTGKVLSHIPSNNISVDTPLTNNQIELIGNSFLTNIKSPKCSEHLHQVDCLKDCAKEVDCLKECSKQVDCLKECAQQIDCLKECAKHVDCLKECAKTLRNDIKENNETTFSHDILSKNEKIDSKQQSEIILANGIDNGIGPDIVPIPAHRIRRRSSKTITTEITAL